MRKINNDSEILALENTKLKKPDLGAKDLFAEEKPGKFTFAKTYLSDEATDLFDDDLVEDLSTYSDVEKKKRRRAARKYKKADATTNLGAEYRGSKRKSAVNSTLPHETKQGEKGYFGFDFGALKIGKI